MKKAVLIIIAFISISSCKNDSVWTKSYESKLYREINAEVSERLPDDSKRQKFVTFIIKRLKEELPKGVESVSKDSLQRLSSKIGKEYGFANSSDANSGLKPTLVPWTPEIEKTLREVFLKDATADNKKQYEQLSDCVLAKLKQINPDSVMVPLTREMAQTIAKECSMEIGRPNK
ncbi:MAG: hypothetical protein WC615_20805 [Mucilaginibacter sp.]|jgi:hypothetical protein|uniref:hypothetical protein n=1 Tax=Mucilaginibacter sp. TaxID=1882438 RepID=UPI003564C7D4